MMTIKVLIVDDNPEDTYTLSRYLKSTQTPYEITTCATGDDCLRHIQASDFDCILLDHFLPDWNGIELIPHILELTLQTGLIICTGLGDEELAVQAMKHGAQDYLVKDHLSPLALDKTVRAAIENLWLKAELQQSQQQTRELEQQLRLVVEQAPIALYNFDDQGNITMAYGKGLQALGLQAHHMLGHTFAELLPDVKELDASVAAATQGHKRTTLTQHGNRIVRSDFFPAQSDEDETYRVFGISHDVTEYQTALERERELIRLQEHFIQRASHEFRTPLAVILASSDILTRYWERLNGDRRLHHLDKIRSYVGQMENLLNDMLEIEHVQSQSQNVDFEAIDFARLCCDVTELFNSRYGPSHPVIAVVPAKGTILGSKHLLHLMLNNILENAVRYSDEDTPIQLELQQHEDRLQLRISDEGIGIPPDELDRLFEPFFRATNTDNIPGTGLGLSAVKHVVHLHRGDIHAESTLGAGTTFILSLPS